MTKCPHIRAANLPTSSTNNLQYPPPPSPRSSKSSEVGSRLGGTVGPSSADDTRPQYDETSAILGEMKEISKNIGILGGWNEGNIEEYWH